MRLHDLFESEPIRISLRGFGSGITPVQKFMQEFADNTSESPFNHRQRVLGNLAVIELSPSIDDRANGIHLSDIVSLNKGNGGPAMKWLCELADKHRVFIELIAKSYSNNPAHPDTEQLARWYESLGFEAEEGWEDWIDEGVEMIRHPK